MTPVLTVVSTQLEVSRVSVRPVIHSHPMNAPALVRVTFYLSFVTSVKDVMFLLAFFCLFVCLSVC